MTTNKVRSEKDIESLRGKESFFKKERAAFPPFLRSPRITDRGDSPGACTAVKRIPANAKAIDHESGSSSRAPTIYLQGFRNEKKTELPFLLQIQVEWDLRVKGEVKGVTDPKSSAFPLS